MPTRCTCPLGYYEDEEPEPEYWVYPSDRERNQVISRLAIMSAAVWTGQMSTAEYRLAYDRLAKKYWRDTEAGKKLARPGR